MTHTAYKVAVGGGNRLLAVRQDTHMTAQTRAAGRRGNDSASLNEDLGQTLLDALQVNFLCCGDDDGAHIRIYLAALEDFGCNAHIVDAAVGAGTDDRLLNLNMAELVDGLGVLRQVRARDGRTECRQVDLDGLLVLGVSVGLECDNLAVYAALDVVHRLVVYREAKIAQNTGMPEWKISRIKDHVFSNEHILDAGVKRFDADPEIADAWYRLTNGTYNQNDIDLLNHEYFESKFESFYKTDYRTAHNKTEESGRIWDPYKENN